MPRNSKRTTKHARVPQLASEGEEAAWYATPEGQRVTEREFRRAIRQGEVEVCRDGEKIRRTDVAKLRLLLEQARANITTPVSIRLPVGDLEAAKRVAEKRGIGYQTLLKELIHNGLTRA